MDAKERVRLFYELNHSSQTLDFARAKRADYMRLSRRHMGIWEVCEHLDSLVDDSDPDTESSQIIHCLQTAEAIRADGHPDWFILAGLVHDLGALYMIRFHSFYPGHSTDTYNALFDSHDQEMFSWVRQFNTYDLYTKHDQPPDVAALKSYYEDLSSRYFPDKLAW